MERCSYCQGEINPTTWTCRRCGRAPLLEAPTQISSVGTQPDQFCRSCGDKLADDARFCGTCGQPVLPTGANTPGSGYGLTDEEHDAPTLPGVLPVPLPWPGKTPGPGAYGAPADAQGGAPGVPGIASGAPARGQGATPGAPGVPAGAQQWIMPPAIGLPMSQGGLPSTRPTQPAVGVASNGGLAFIPGEPPGQRGGEQRGPQDPRKRLVRRGLLSLLLAAVALLTGVSAYLITQAQAPRAEPTPTALPTATSTAAPSATSAPTNTPTSAPAATRPPAPTATRPPAPTPTTPPAPTPTTPPAPTPTTPLAPTPTTPPAPTPTTPPAPTPTTPPAPTPTTPPAPTPTTPPAPTPTTPPASTPTTPPASTPTAPPTPTTASPPITFRC